MNDWLALLISLSYLVMTCLFYMQQKNFRKEIEQLHEAFNEERQQLLDRIMSNNIQEYKAYSQNNPVVRSASGNFLIDRMEKTLKTKYQD